MFYTKVVEKIKTHFLCSITFFNENHVVGEIIEKNVVTAREATDDNTAHMNCMLDTSRRWNHTAFPQQHCICKSTSMLCLYVQYIACLVIHV